MSSERRGSSKHHPRRPRANVTGRVYDPLLEDGSPPRRVARVTIEPMDPSGVELVAADLLQLLEWAVTNEERHHG